MPERALTRTPFDAPQRAIPGVRFVEWQGRECVASFGDPVAEHEFRRAKRRTQGHHRKYRARIVLSHNDMDVLHPDGCAVQLVGSDGLRAAQLAPSDLLSHHVFLFPRSRSPITKSLVDS